MLIFNNTPGPGNVRRYLVETPAGGPLLLDHLDAHATSVGAGLTTRHSDQFVADPILARALRLADTLLCNGQVRLVDGTAMMPTLRDADGAVRFTQADCVDALRATGKAAPVRVQALLNACTCAAQQLVCEH